MPHGQGEPAQVAHYPTPGLRLLNTLPKLGVRGIKQATTGQIYAVAAEGVYSIDPTTWAGTHLGDLMLGRSTPVSMQDNGTDLVIVDGGGTGWSVHLADNSFHTISDPTGMFSGADKVDYLDTYLLFNKPNTPQFYSSDSLALTFDPLFFANKEAFSDLLRTLAVVHREIWLFGERTTEVFANVGAPDFPFQAVPGTFVDHGCIAKYSVAIYDNSVFWLSYDRAGKGIVLQGAGYKANRVSTFAIENTISEYDTIDDAIGMTYQLAGHTFYVLTFPKADATWVYDVSTSLWHEWVWLDTNGREHRHRANCIYPCNGMLICGDWENGNLYELTLDEYTDNGVPIKRLRAWPHLVNQSDRVFYRQFVADLEAGWASNAIDQQRLISTTFTAADGTLLEDYTNPADTGLWTLVSGSSTIEGDALTGTGVYQSNAIATTGDYVVRFSVTPSEYDAVSNGTMYALARANDASHGYRVAVAGDGTQYTLSLTVLGGSTGPWSIALGTIPSGRYNVIATFRGTTISVQCQRTSDGLWLRADGAWVVDNSALAIVVTDASYAGPGVVLIGSS